MQGGIIRVRLQNQMARQNYYSFIQLGINVKHKIQNADDKKSAHEWATFRSSSSSSTLDGSVPTYNEL